MVGVGGVHKKAGKLYKYYAVRWKIILIQKKMFWVSTK
jgi:hypothetical protein